MSLCVFKPLWRPVINQTWEIYKLKPSISIHQVTLTVNSQQFSRYVTQTDKRERGVKIPILLHWSHFIIITFSGLGLEPLINRNLRILGLAWRTILRKALGEQWVLKDTCRAYVSLRGGGLKLECGFTLRLSGKIKVYVLRKLNKHKHGYEAFFVTGIDLNHVFLSHVLRSVVRQSV